MDGGGLHVFCGLRSNATNGVRRICWRALCTVCWETLRRVDREDPMVFVSLAERWIVNVKRVYVFLFFGGVYNVGDV